MNTVSYVYATDPPVAIAQARPLTRSEGYADASRRMRNGKRLVLAGFAVSVAGIIGYSLLCFVAGWNQDVGAAAMENASWLVGSALGVIGLGTLLWLVGSFAYLRAAMDSDPAGTDLSF